MLKKDASANGDTLVATVQGCLPTLEALALKVHIYGDVDDAAKLQSIIDRLRSASRNESPQKAKAQTDFLVNGTFKVSRQQVANTLWHAFTGEIDWFTIANKVPPRNLSFRSIAQTSPGIVDYPLNEGGSVCIRTNAANAEVFDLQLERIAAGLEVLACRYPRHFADLMNDNADAITADVLMQCCVFGELIYG